MRSKEELEQFAPWEKEERDRTDKMGSGRIGSIPPSNRQRSRLRSKSKSRDHDHLEMYILAREKERLEKYGETLGRRLKSIAATWKEVKHTMYEFQKKKIGKEGIEDLINSKQQTKPQEKKITKNMKKKEWHY